MGLGALESHSSFRNCGYVAADIDSLPLLITGKPHVQQTTAAHLGALFTDKTRVGTSRKQAVFNHEGSQRTGGTPRCGIFGYAILRREHARVNTLARLREDKDTELFAFAIC